MSHNNNAYDLLRLLLALFVLFSHAYFLTNTGLDPLATFSKGQVYFAEIGVLGFFALSGYLITSSIENMPNAFRFLYKRFLRLFPGYWVCLIVTGFIIAPAIYYLNNHTINGFSFTGSNSSVTFFLKNAFLAINQWSVGNVLDHSVYKESLNGSLWTLYSEALCYVVTLVLSFFGLLNKNKSVFILLFLFVYVVYAVNLYNAPQFGPTFLTLNAARKLYIAYMCGMGLYIFRDKIVIDKKGQLFILLLSVALLKFGGFLLLAPILIAVLCILGFANFKVSLKYDISYGMYIYAFPIQQLVITEWGNSLGFWGSILTCILLTSVLGFLSYVLVEKPFLKLKNVKFKAVG